VAEPGLKQRVANSSQVETSVVGSNPTASAIKKNDI
tara:strand:+ start:153 stop:260 length:108 start_codon:yes stop_codon:yes gene_type:complete